MGEDSPRAQDDLDALPRTRRVTRWSRVWKPFWVLPMVIVVLAVAAGWFLPVFDEAADHQLPYVFGGGPDGARDMLGNIAGAMISVTGLVFSITMVVVQLASSQYSPRVLDNFLSSRITQVTLGIFAATFVYALTVLRSVRGDFEEDTAMFVPQLSVTVGFLLVLASVGMFLAFIHHITNSIKVTSIISHLGDQTLSVIDRYLPEPDAPGAQTGEVEWAPPPSWRSTTMYAEDHGSIAEVHYRSLVRWADEHGAVVQLLHPVGLYLSDGEPVVVVWWPDGVDVLPDDELKKLRSWVQLGQDRYLNQDPALGVRKLVDIADRALSNGTNDPTTAVQVMDELHRVLRRSVQRADLPSLVRHEGELRLVHRPQRVETLLDLALEEPLHYSTDTPQVPARVERMLRDLLTVALPAHRPRVEHWLAEAREAGTQAEANGAA